MSEQEQFEAWWKEKGFNSVILRAAAWTAWMAGAELKEPVTPANQPDPDEWVVLDPVKYADHVPRVGIDQFEGAGKDTWVIQAKNHTTQTVGAFFDSCGAYHRCRRRDLPPVKNDWAEDFQHENGNYENKCSRCNVLFRGHKRRVMCKRCDLPPVEQPQPAKTRVRLFASMGGLHVRMPGEITEGIGREIHHDAEGFYVEQQ